MEGENGKRSSPAPRPLCGSDPIGNCMSGDHERKMLFPARWGDLAVSETTERRLTVIMVADVVGYSRLMEADEARTLAALRSRRKAILEPVLRAHGGRVVKLMGDGVLVEFASAVNAVVGAVELQEKMGRANDDEPELQRILLRVGINLGDVIGEDADIFGEGVNIAARLELLAEPGGICVSAKVLEEVRGKVALVEESLGEVALKNIARPVHVFRIRQPSPPSGKPRGLALPDKPSIAVLPFENMSGDAEQEYFGDGLAEDIITALSRVRGFFVIARNSTFAYKGKSVDVRQIARDLGVRYVLEGSVRRSGDRLRVTGQLIDASSGAHVWSERYDRAVTDIFAVQDEITESVVASIELQVYAAENVRSEGKPTESLTAWGCVVRAMPYVWSWAAQDNQNAVGLLKQALEADPSYARASSLLAWAYAARAQLGWSDASDELEKALTMARQAIEQDWEDPWAHLSAGYVHMVSRRSVPAVQEFSEASTGLAAVVAPPGSERFAISYQLLAREASPPRRLRLRTWVDDGDEVPTAVPVFPAADYQEREVYDLMGIRFAGHPNLERIFLPEGWDGHPHRKDYPIGGEPVQFSDGHERLASSHARRAPAEVLWPIPSVLTRPRTTPTCSRSTSARTTPRPTASCGGHDARRRDGGRPAQRTRLRAHGHREEHGGRSRGGRPSRTPRGPTTTPSSRTSSCT